MKTLHITFVRKENELVAKEETIKNVVQWNWNGNFMVIDFTSGSARIIPMVDIDRYSWVEEAANRQQRRSNKKK